MTKRWITPTHTKMVRKMLSNRMTESAMHIRETEGSDDGLMGQNKTLVVIDADFKVMRTTINSTAANVSEMVIAARKSGQLLVAFFVPWDAVVLKDDIFRIGGKDFMCISDAIESTNAVQKKVICKVKA